LWKEVSGTRTYFHYADEGLTGEYDSTGAEIKTYGYKPNSIFTTDPLFMKVGSVYYFYHTDHLGTPQKMTAVNGAVVWSAKYSSFLEADVDPSSTITNNLRAPGQYFDQETALHYNWQRYYDSQVGRYLKDDPIGLKGGINYYIYCLNNPVRWTDPIGLKKLIPNLWSLFIDTVIEAYKMGEKISDKNIEDKVNAIQNAINEQREIYKKYLDDCYAGCNDEFPCKQPGWKGCRKKCWKDWKKTEDNLKIYEDRIRQILLDPSFIDRFVQIN